MVPIPGGVASDRHHPEKGPADRVKISPFLIDRMPVTNCQFRKIRERDWSRDLSRRPKPRVDARMNRFMALIPE